MSRNTTPEWYDRPTCPGMWICMPSESTKHVVPNAQALNLTADDLARGAPFHTSRVYGPIPLERPKVVSHEAFARLSPWGKGYAVYMLGSRDDEPFVPNSYEPTDEERTEYERGQQAGVLDAQDSEE